MHDNSTISPLERPAPEPQQTDSGHYRLGERLSDSPSARVYLAQSVADGGTVIVKQPSSAAAAEHEAVLLRFLNGAGAPLLLASDEIAGRPALVMERLSGRLLADLVREDPRFATAPRFRRILEGLAAALARLHGQGVVHGDLKPDHVMVDEGDEVRLIDFAASAVHGQSPPGAIDTAWLTPGFAAPEQFVAEAQPDMRWDIFAFGAVAFWAATGRVPPPAGGSTDIHEVPLRQADLPDDLCTLVLACLRPKPEERPGDVASLRDLLVGGDPLAGRGPLAPVPAPAPATVSGPDAVPDTIRVRRRRIVAPRRDSTAGGDARPPKRGNLGRLFLWLFLLALVAGSTAVGVWQGKPLYDKHFKTAWLVDPSGKGDAASLVEAVARAGNEVTFLLAPGEHDGAVLQDGRYRIEAAQADAAAPVILAGPAGCLSAINTRVTLVGLVFRGTGGEAGRACIEQAGGALTLRASVMERLSGPAILARDGANLQVAESEFLAIDSGAIGVAGGSVLELLGTKIEQAGGNAVTLESGALLTMRDNLIIDAGGSGLLLVQGARASLDGDVIQGSAVSALEVASGAEVEARDVTLAASGGVGLFVHGAARLRMTESRVTGNSLSGLFADGAAEVELRDNAIVDNGEHGILLLGARAGRLERNSLERNLGYGLVLDPATRVLLGDNSLEANQAGPVMDAREQAAERAEDGAE